MRLRFLVLLSIACVALGVAAPGALAQSVFTVANVHVDANGASSTEAANIALNEGRPKAWQILYRRLTRAQDWARQPPLDAATLQRISLGTTIANERRSTTRYVADVTYMFNPDAVARILRAANIAYVQDGGKRVLLVPMAPGYARGPWMDAFADPKLHDPAMPFVLPAGDAADQQTLGALRFDSAGWADVAPAAARAHAGEAALVQAVYAAGRFVVHIRRLAPNEVPASAVIDVPPVAANTSFAENLAANYAAAAAAAVAGAEDLWKSRAVVNFNVRGQLVADVRAGSVAQWGAIQSALAGIDNVTAVNVVAMDIGDAQVSISYFGSTGQLRDAMSAQGLALAACGDGCWTLSAAAPSAAGQ